MRLKEVQEKAIEEKKAAVVGAVNSCKEAAARESMQKSVRSLLPFLLPPSPALTRSVSQNELKRTVNKLEETTKRLNKVQNEFAKSKFVLSRLLPSLPLWLIDSLPTEELTSSTTISLRPPRADQRRTAMTVRRYVLTIFVLPSSRTDSSPLRSLVRTAKLLRLTAELPVLRRLSSTRPPT